MDDLSAYIYIILVVVILSLTLLLAFNLIIYSKGGNVSLKRTTNKAIFLVLFFFFSFYREANIGGSCAIWRCLNGRFGVVYPSPRPRQPPTTIGP